MQFSPTSRMVKKLSRPGSAGCKCTCDEVQWSVSPDGNVLAVVAGTPRGCIMSFVLHPWQLLVTILAGWVNREQQQRIEYLRTENQVLKEKLGKKRILLNDDQRRRLAVQGKILGRKVLGEMATLFTPDTILRWHRLLVAQKWTPQATLYAAMLREIKTKGKDARFVKTERGKFASTAAK